MSAAIAFIKQWFDLKSAILGALLMSSLVAVANSAHGPQSMLTAAFKQSVYTFFVAGFVMQFCRWLAERDLSERVAILNATLVPTVLTVVMVYQLHSFKGTPEPFWSTVPVAVISLVAFFVVSRNVVVEKRVGDKG